MQEDILGPKYAEAAQRADALLEEGAWHGALTWRRILDAIKQLQAPKPAEGEPTQ